MGRGIVAYGFVARICDQDDGDVAQERDGERLIADADFEGGAKAIEHILVGAIRQIARFSPTALKYRL